MNTKELKRAEKYFLSHYPGGFEHPAMIEIGKKHKMVPLEAFAKESFTKKNFNEPQLILSEVARLMSRSTLVSMFEKPKFKEMVSFMKKKDGEIFVEAIYELLHGKEKVGFENFVEELRKRKLARWSLATAVQTYYRPKKEVFIKPTTTKLIIDKLELPLVYKPTPSWEFYSKYRKIIKEMKPKVNKSLSPNNPAFCGFLMMSLEERL